MTNKPMLSVERELRALAEKACGTAKDSPEYRRFLEAINPAVILDLTAKPAAQHQGAHVAEVDEGDDGLFIEFVYGENGNPLKRGDKLYLRPSEQPAPLKIGSGVTVENIGFGSEQERKPYLVFDGGGFLTEVNLIDVSLVSNRQAHTIADLEAIGVRVEQPAPVADHPQCEECKGWVYHENHHEGGGTECGECGGSGKAPVAVVMPERKTKAGYSGYIEKFQSEAAGLYNSALDDVARLNGVTK